RDSVVLPAFARADGGVSTANGFFGPLEDGEGPKQFWSVPCARYDRSRYRSASADDERAHRSDGRGQDEQFRRVLFHGRNDHEEHHQWTRRGKQSVLGRSDPSDPNEHAGF